MPWLSTTPMGTTVQQDPWDAAQAQNTQNMWNRAGQQSAAAWGYKANQDNLNERMWEVGQNQTNSANMYNAQAKLQEALARLGYQGMQTQHQWGLEQRGHEEQLQEPWRQASIGSLESQTRLNQLMSQREENQLKNANAAEAGVGQAPVTPVTPAERQAAAEAAMSGAGAGKQNLAVRGVQLKEAGDDASSAEGELDTQLQGLMGAENAGRRGVLNPKRLLGGDVFDPDYSGQITAKAQQLGGSLDRLQRALNTVYGDPGRATTAVRSALLKHLAGQNYDERTWSQILKHPALQNILAKYGIGEQNPGVNQ